MRRFIAEKLMAAAETGDGPSNGSTEVARQALNAFTGLL
jgi:hypothetical protein